MANPANGSPPGSTFPANAIDANVHGKIGLALDRVEGPAKVSGRARYSYEYLGAGEVGYGLIVGSTIAKGKITSVHVEAAEAAPGVMLVITHLNAPKQPPFVPNDVSMPETQPGRPAIRPRPYLADDQVRYLGEPIALVVADSFERARHAAALVTATYEEATPTSDLSSARPNAYKPRTMQGGHAPDSARGDFEAAFAASEVKIDVTYDTPMQNHNAMEPHATMASWDGDRLTVHTSAQVVALTHQSIAVTTGLPGAKVRVITPFVGGAFGGKALTEADVILAAHATMRLRRPVKLAMTRQQTFVNVAHRPAAIQRIRFGASKDGRLNAIAHDVVEETASYQEFAEQTAAFGRSLYAAPNRQTTHRLVRLDLPAPFVMRAPGEAPGMLAYEAALDELAHALAMDPIELRVRNEPDVDPESGLPFATRNLVPCLREGAKLFGWENRPRQAASRREGDRLIGYGVSSAFRGNQLRRSQARARIDRDGVVTIETGMTDLGTGTLTILTQIAAEALGLPLNKVVVGIGDSLMPIAAGSIGSWGAASSGSSVLDACERLKATLGRMAGLTGDDLSIRGDLVVAGGRSVSLASLMAAEREISADGSITPGDEQKAFSHAAYGAHFAEVAVDAVSGEIRLRRMLGVFAAGRILNLKTARSQALGGMIWGLSSALMEETVVDHRYASIVNGDLAEYHIPVHADVGDIEAVFLPEPNDPANPLRIKGVGELGICGAGAAVANAVFNATGIRVRSYPITIDKLIADLPAVRRT